MEPVHDEQSIGDDHPAHEPAAASIEEIEEEWAALSCDCEGDFF